MLRGEGTLGLVSATAQPMLGHKPKASLGSCPPLCKTSLVSPPHRGYTVVERPYPLHTLCQVLSFPPPPRGTYSPQAPCTGSTPLALSRTHGRTGRAGGWAGYGVEARSNRAPKGGRTGAGGGAKTKSLDSGTSPLQAVYFPKK